jgi:hypothetical protein
METGTIQQTVVVGNRKNAFVAFLLSGLIAGSALKMNGTIRGDIFIIPCT